MIQGSLAKEDSDILNFNGKKEFAVNLHTIIMFVGPDGCGKTKFAIEQLMSQLKMRQVGRKKIKISYINLDQIFSELHDDPSISKNSDEYKSVTEQAKSILFNKLNNFASYPVASDFIIIDSNGFDPIIREEILKIAEEQHYAVSAFVFNYKNKEEYNYSDYGTGEIKNPKPFHLKQLKRLMSGELSKKDFNFIEIDSREFEKYNFVIEDYDSYDKYILSDDIKYIIVGDVHGCLEELKSLLIKNGFLIDLDDKVSHPYGKQAVFVGDIIDKGYDIVGTIEFIYKNIDIFKLVKGNHERFVYNALSGLYKSSDMPPDEIVDTYFSSIGILKENTNAKEKFFAIFNNMQSFFVHKDFIVTHVSCQNKYLGKISAQALKACQDFRVPKVEDFEDFSSFIQKFDEKIEFVKADANDFYPRHIFGHVETKEVSIFKNKINIDTACIAGGCLTSVEIFDNGLPLFESVPAGNKIIKEEGIKFNFFD